MVDLTAPFLTTHNVMELLGLKKGACYKLIRDLNKELEGKGYYTVRGRVPTKYFCKRFFIK